MKKIILLLCLFSLSCSQEPQTLEELRKAGQNAYIDTDYISAQKYFNKALLIKASDRDALYYLGQTFQKLKQDDSAMYYFKRADILFPNDRELNIAIYVSSKILNDHQNTIRAINALIHTGDKPETYFFELANLNLKTGNIIVSFQYLRKIWENKTDDPAIYLGLGNVAVQVDSMDFAVKIMREAVERFGEKDEFVTNLAIYLAGADKLPEAERVLKKILIKNPNSQPLLFNLANVLALFDSKSKKEESLRIYKKLREDNGNIMNIDSIIIDLEQSMK